MREIVLDTETTGINPRDGHRIIEIGALELMHHLPTGKELHIYINPEPVSYTHLTLPTIYSV